MASIFGSEFAEIWPKADATLKLTDFGKNLLMKCKTLEKPDPSKVNIDDFMRKSSNFPREFGTNTCRVISQPKSRYPIIEQQIASAYPVIHERVLGLYLDFLEHKSKFGNKHESEIFPKLSLTDFVQRLLAKRCVSFFAKNDKFLLITGEKGASGFMEIGTDAEKPPLLIQNVLSYDEIKLSALLSVSSHSEYINDGSRQNCGVIEMDKSKIERDGVVIGLIGARLVRRDVMEFQDIVISKTQNTKANGYGRSIDAPVDSRPQDYRRIWKEFYEESDFLYENVIKDDKRFGASRNKNDYFDNLIMKKRYTISFDTLLLDSEARAARADKQAYIHVVGIGLGIWRAAEQQEKIFLETFAQRLKELLPKLNHILVVHFSWFQLNEWADLKNNGIYKSETHPDGGIRTFISKRNPADKLKLPEQENMILIVSYAWDGNALPGNEFWMKMLKSSGDSSTACSTLITELHNPHINSDFVNGANLHIASPKYGILHIADYDQSKSWRLYVIFSKRIKLIFSGNDREQKVYKELSLTNFVQRLLTKRCVSFVEANDTYLLIDGTKGSGGFEQIGTSNEKSPLILKDVLSYDEIKLSALLSVSSHTEFLNDGNRYNAGRIETDKSKIETEGVVIGLIGGRFERPGYMEWQDIIISEDQNTTQNGYGCKVGHELTRASDYRRVWNKFYEDQDLLYDEAKEIKSDRFFKFRHIFDNVLMKKRYTISFDTLLLDAEARAAIVNKQAYVHVVGIGLGVWKAVDHQGKLFLETFAQRLKALLPKLNHIGVVHFSWFHMNEWADLKDGGIYRSELHPNGGIRTLLSNRNPADKLPTEFQNMLSVVSYAWDGNALPGNEFWLKNLTATGDSSTACSTLISELHNPHINSSVVNGENLRIATMNRGVIHLRDYCQNN